ncbi:MAG: YbhB/YbcL family Raf kinase inhibitor-like protein [Deltaproteobacteria bacterium]|nr:YbhB/YbcL family Raf kinase inhibitor-like protein [Deltaproteobacteria bacterium]
MTDQFTVHIDGWSPGAPIPARFAFGQPGADGPFATSDNLSPAIRWSNAPAGTRSFVILCHDPDVPSSGDDVNQVGKTVPADLPRVDFFHWVLIDLASDCEGLAEGAASRGVTPRGKPTGRTEHGVTGANDYTQWFAGDADMEGTYGSYDGPCPPWNDSIVHHYHFTVYALDVESLAVPDGFSGPDVRRAMEGHILGQASQVGTYSMNPAVVA